MTLSNFTSHRNVRKILTNCNNVYEIQEVLNFQLLTAEFLEYEIMCNIYYRVFIKNMPILHNLCLYSIE
jgi:hypothetical protein